MRRALVILSLVAAIAAEAPYHLPRPGLNAPVFNYPSAPAPAPQYQPQPQFRPQPQYQPQIQPQPQFQPQLQFQPQPQFNHNSGYNYPAPSPQYIQPSHHHHSQPAPPPLAHHHHHHHHHQPAPVYIPSPAPQPLPIAQPLPAPQPLPALQPQPIYQQPSGSYGVPIARAPVQVAPSFPVFAPQPAPRPQPFPQSQVNSISQVYQPVSYQQQQQPQQYSQQHGYNYQQPQVVYQPQAQALPSQQLIEHSSAPVLSSYQADSNQYNIAQEQPHRDALDSLVVGRVQNIIKEDEHSVARNAGYQSLVSGVSLEQAKPSVEITSFVQTSPLVTSSGPSTSVSSSSSSSVASSPAVIPSTDYGVPTGPAVISSQSAESAPSFNFLPQNKPAISYGPPN